MAMERTVGELDWELDNRTVSAAAQIRVQRETNGVVERDADQRVHVLLTDSEEASDHVSNSLLPGSSGRSHLVDEAIADLRETQYSARITNLENNPRWPRNSTVKSNQPAESHVENVSSTHLLVLNSVLAIGAGSSGSGYAKVSTAVDCTIAARSHRPRCQRARDR